MNLMATNQPLTMSSREIAELTGKEHKNVKRDIEKMLKDLGEDKLKFERIYFDSMKRRQSECLLDRDHTDCLLTGYSSVLRMRVIKRWKELEGQQPKLPQTFAEALQLAADQAKQLELAKPKVEFHDTVVQSNQTYKFQEAGKKLQQRPNKFIAWMREKGYINTANVPYQRYIEQGLFKTHSGVNDHGHAYTQSRITTKGLAYFASKLNNINL
jgi:phage antirepressor YoqD-like protein